MKTVNVTIDLFSFNELNKEAQQVAISEHESFLNPMLLEYENEEGEMISEYIEYTEAEVIESIEVNEYLFFSNGKLAQTCTFTGAHPRAGETEFIFLGKSYII